jgi:hypothetical protein
VHGVASQEARVSVRVSLEHAGDCGTGHFCGHIDAAELGRMHAIEPMHGFITDFRTTGRHSPRLFVASAHFLLAMFARHACDKWLPGARSHRIAVAKLQCGGDSVVVLLIRGFDEYAVDRGCCAQRQDTE